MALGLVKELVKVCDICIYMIIRKKPFRIFKKRKEQVYYDECEGWYLEDIQALTGVQVMVNEMLN